MTWIEITFFVLLGGVFIFGLCIDINENGFGLCVLFPLIFSLFLGLFPMTITDTNTKTTFVKEEPLQILQKVTIDGELIVITDQADKITFTKYKDVPRINDGAQLVKRHYKKDVYYGPDSSWSNIEVK